MYARVLVCALIYATKNEKSDVVHLNIYVVRRGVANNICSIYVAKLEQLQKYVESESEVFLHGRILASYGAK